MLGALGTIATFSNRSACTGISLRRKSLCVESSHRFLLPGNDIAAVALH